MNKIAIIPARGGSKRILKKSIKKFLGTPIIAYSIKAALESNLFDEIIVSTDDKEISDIAKKYGAKVPFFRSSKNSDDFATTFDVLKEVLKNYKDRNANFEFGCCIYPAAPLVSRELLIKGYDKISKENWDTVLPIVEFNHPIERAMQLDTKNRLKFILPENSTKRTQDVKKTFHDTGQFYWFNVEKLLKNDCLISENTSGFIVSQNDTQDIDNSEDWRLAESKYKFKNK
tara:strand:- start:1655 stop:2344 length:690 start_codon:yes stop_codon:yes gene_type:complete